MSPNSLFNIGVAICAAAAVGSIGAAIALFTAKARLNAKFDVEYGKRRR